MQINYGYAPTNQLSNGKRPSKTYAPNGKRECARRVRQAEAILEPDRKRG